MTHPYIEAALKYRKAEAVVLREAESFAASGDSKALFIAVEEMQEARAEYKKERAKVWVETGGEEKKP